MVSKEDGQNTIVAALYAFERQWGAFGGSFCILVISKHWMTCRPMRKPGLLCCQRSTFSVVTKLQQQYLNVHSVSLQYQEKAPLEFASQIKATACERTTRELLALVQEAKHLDERCVALANNKLPFWEKVLAQLGLASPVNKTLKHFALVRDAIGLEWNPWSSEQKPTIAKVVSACQGLVAFVQSCALQSRMGDLQNALESERQELDSTSIPTSNASGGRSQT